MSSPRLESVHDLTGLTGIPIARVTVENATITVDLSEEERQIVVVFRPYQAMRITTADCFALSGDMFITPRTIMEVRDSAWLAELKESLSKVDATANFMDRARHFVIPCEDNFIEVVAWAFDVTLSGTDC